MLTTTTNWIGGGKGWHGKGRGGVTGMATMAMAIALFGTLWPLMALAIPLFAL